jgi:hypothetical protein
MVHVNVMADLVKMISAGVTGLVAVVDGPFAGKVRVRPPRAHVAGEKDHVVIEQVFKVTTEIDLQLIHHGCAERVLIAAGRRLRYRHRVHAVGDTDAR